MSLEDSRAVYVMFRRDQSKEVLALFPLQAYKNDAARCQTAKLADGVLQLSGCGYEQFVRNRHTVKAKDYRDLLRAVKQMFGEEVCVIQQATDYMHSLRAARARAKSKGNVDAG